MGISPSEARALSFWEFTAMRHGWLERHKNPNADDEPVQAPDEETVRQAQAELRELGIAG